MYNLDEPDFLKIASILDIKGMMEKGNEYLWNHDKPKITEKRINILKRNIADIIGMVYTNETASLFNLDQGLREIYSQKGNEDCYIELGGGSIGTSIMLNHLRDARVLERKSGKYKLTKKYENFIDQLYLNRIAA